MRASKAHILRATGKLVIPQAASRSRSLAPPRCAVQRRANSTATTAPQSKLLGRTTPNPVTLCYEERCLLQKIPLTDFVPDEPISGRPLATTTPAKVETPEALKREDFGGSIPIGDRVRWLYRLGRSYLSFYKTGFQNIWQNYKELRKIRQRVEGRTLEDVVKYGMAGSPVLSRRDYQLALRTRHDLGKLVPFSIVFAICGEFTPLVILLIGSVAVPYTCRIPKQEQQDFLKFVRKQSKYEARADHLLQQHRTSDAGMRWKQEFLEAYRLHVNPFSRPLPGLGSFWHSMYIGPRLRKHCEEVLSDTILIRREGGFGQLSPREVFQWSLKYGLRELREHIEAQYAEGLPIDANSTSLKEMLLPTVEAEAEYILDVEWDRVKPENQWLAVFRPLQPKNAVISEGKVYTQR